MSKLTPKTKTALRIRRHNRIRARVRCSAMKPRLAVFRSNRFVYAQVINDDTGTTIASASALGDKKMSLLDQAKVVGIAIAKDAKGKGVTAVVFDRGGFTYAGRIAALADAARAGGLTF